MKYLCAMLIAVLLCGVCQAANQGSGTWSFTIIKDTAAPTIGLVPANGAIDVPQDVTIVATCTDSQSPIDLNTIEFTVNGVIIPSAQLVVNSTNPKAVTVSYKPAAGFGLGQVITVNVKAKDTAL